MTAKKSWNDGASHRPVEHGERSSRRPGEVTPLGVDPDVLAERLLGNLGGPRQVLELAGDPTACALQPRTYFVASLIDGILTVDDLIDVSGMPRLEALQTLAYLAGRGLVAPVGSTAARRAAAAQATALETLRAPTVAAPIERPITGVMSKVTADPRSDPEPAPRSVPLARIPTSVRPAPASLPDWLERGPVSSAPQSQVRGRPTPPPASRGPASLRPSMSLPSVRPGASVPPSRPSAQETKLLVQTGDDHARAEEWVEAAKAYARAVHGAPRSAAIAHKAAHAMLRAGADLGRAAALAQSAISLAPGEIVPRLTLARIYAAAARPSAAVVVLESALGVAPHDERIHSLLRRLKQG